MTTSRLLLPARPRGQWCAWGISLLVHAGVLAWLLYALPILPPAATDAPRRMRFVLVPPRPRPAPPVTVATVPQASPPRTIRADKVPRSRPAAASATAAAPAARPNATAAQSTSTPVITSDAPTAADALPADAAGSSTGAEANGASPPGFDMDEARKTAHLIAKHRKDGLVALPRPEPPLERDDRLGRAIERARRPDCKSAYSGLGLLAVIPLAKDAVTGSGCKW
jgi:hypothetical protein